MRKKNNTGANYSLIFVNLHEILRRWRRGTERRPEKRATPGKHLKHYENYS
jgi:hypothetical protein